VIDAGAGLFWMMCGEMTMDDLVVLAVIVGFMDMFGRQPHESKHGGYCQPSSQGPSPLDIPAEPLGWLPVSSCRASRG
jgi:hypothetical protein